MVRTIRPKHPITWSPELPVTPAMLDPLLDDMGIGTKDTPADLEARKATKQYCLDTIILSARMGDQLRIGHIERMALAFNHGYVSSLTKRKV